MGKEAAPPREWLGRRRFDELRDRYLAELYESGGRPVHSVGEDVFFSMAIVTFVYAAGDPAHVHTVVLKQ